MKRRTFVKALSLASMGAGFGNAYGLPIPNSLGLSRRMLDVDISYNYNSSSFYKINGQGPDINFMFPRVINIFLYGGPSELAGNLSNIGYINSVSQSKYIAQLLVKQSAENQNGLISPNDMWLRGGGEAMETMLAGGSMTMYRTMYRRKDDSKAHRESILQNQVGNLDMQQPGIGSTIAELITAQASMGAFGDKKVGDLLFPIVSFEGESFLFNRGDAVVQPALRPAALGNNGSSTPYNRDLGRNLDRPKDELLDALAYANTHSAQLSEITRAFKARGSIATKLGGLLGTDVVNSQITSFNSAFGSPINYGTSVNNPNANRFGERLRSAVTLMINNPDTLFIAMGTDGLGGWDDHNEAEGSYSVRMDDLMHAIMAGTAHIHAAAKSGIKHADSILINVIGDFGRNVNLNNARGWDHGNNQNLYTFGGRNFRTPEQLGKIVGETTVIGTPGQNRLFTAPAASSYEFEPFSMASTIYKYYGVTNPEVLTGEPAINENAAPTKPLETWTPTAGSIHEKVLNHLLSP